MAVSLLVTIMVISCGCNRKKSAIATGLTTYQVKVSGDSFFQWDEFVDKVELIRLEMNEQSVIGKFRIGIVDKDGIFVYHWSNSSYPMSSAKLIHFDVAGNFIKEIGRQGKGPGEFLEMREFCIAENHVFTLDYQKIHCYDKNSGKHIDSWSFKDETGFNPINFVVFDKDNYYLWDTDPINRDKNEREYYHLREMRNGKITSEYFKCNFSTILNQRFSPSGDDSYYINPIDGEDVVYRLTKESLQADFTIDFGNMALSTERVKELKNSTERNAFLKSNAFKNISDVLETKDYIYFQCTGPNAYGYEGLINKKTKEVKFGRTNYRKKPQLFFSDRSFLYGYFDPTTLFDRQVGEDGINMCFNEINNLKINENDNLIVVKIHLKDK